MNAQKDISQLCGFSAILLAFIVSVYLRAPYIGTLSDGHHQWLTAHSTLIVENWIEDGIINDLFLGVSIPASIELPNFEARGVYVSYPLGSLFIIYLLKTIFYSVDTIRLVHLYGLLNHFLISILIFTIVTRLKFNVSKYYICMFGTLAAIAYLYFPAPYYWHAMVYFADQAAILPFILIIYLETLIRTNPKKQYLILQSVVLLFAAATDYIALPLSMVLLVFRLITPAQFKRRLDISSVIANAIQLFFPVAILYIFYILFIVYHGFGEQLFDIFLFRTGVDSQGDTDLDNLLYKFALEHLGWYFPLIMLAMIWLTYNVYKTKSVCFVIPLIGFSAATLQVILLRNHSAIHDFAALKFFSPLAMTLFGIVPLVMLERLNRGKAVTAHLSTALNGRAMHWMSGFTQKVSAQILFMTFSGLLICMVLTHMFVRPEFPSPGVKGEELARYIRDHSGFRDVYIGFDEFKIELYPPQKISISRKLVHEMKSVDDIERFLSKLSPYATLYVLVSPSNECIGKIDTTEIRKIGSAIVMRVRPSAYLRLKSCIAEI